MMNFGYNNLINLLQEKEIGSFSKQRKVGNVIELVSDNSIWPNGFYHLSQLQSSGEIDKFLVPESDLIFILESDVDKYNFKTMGFRPADVWYSMFLNLHSAKCINSSNKVHLRLVESADDLSVWKKHVERIFFNNFFIANDLISCLHKSNKFAFLNFFVANEIVGSALLYLSGKDVGLYFFAIHENYRKNGFGFDALVCVCNFVVQKGGSKLMLESTRQGKELYIRSGFQIEERIHIYKRR